MSNILVIKHGSLGDVVQISGALRDIRNAHSKDKITILTSTIYRDIFKQCPFVDDVIVDRRKSFLDIVYLAELRKDVKKYEFKKVYDLQIRLEPNFIENISLELKIGVLLELF